MKYIGLLRGINVGGNTKVPMAELKKICEKLGYTNVKTLLNSGNVVFETEEKSVESLSKTTSEALETKFGFPITVIIRTHHEIVDLVKTNPFKGITLTPDTRLYVTFFAQKQKRTKDIPFESTDGGYRLIHQTDMEVCSVITLSSSKNTTDLMNMMNKEYGKTITTRNWTTIVKLAAL